MVVTSLRARVTPLQSSVAMASPVAAGSVEALQSTEASGGQVTTGGTVSSNFPFASQTEVTPLRIVVTVTV